LLFINLFTRKNIVRLPHNEIPNKKSKIKYQKLNLDRLRKHKSTDTPTIPNKKSKIKNQKYVQSCRYNHTSPASHLDSRCAAGVVGGGISGDGIAGGIKEKSA
jgi:hypothetical protein